MNKEQLIDKTQNQEQAIKNISIVKEMESSFLDYAMSVIVSRAIPDSRDGLKPVHRRILYAMFGLDMNYNKSFKKSARAVGEVIAKYHPHGDVAVYESLVRMAQSFSLRYPLVKGQGNFGSIDGDSAAAMRYTEAKLSKISSLMLEDINKKTVRFQENYDGSETEPVVLPSKIPNLLLNGSTGIAVGMATSIPPHNLNEILDAAILVLNNPDTEIRNLLEIVKGPDFPTGGIIVNPNDLFSVYETGYGRVIIRAKVEIINDEKRDRNELIVTEIPYMINKSLLILKIADLVKNKQINSISDLRDESNREGIRVVIKLKRGAIPEVELNKLYKLTQLQSTFSINFLSLVNNRPKILNLKESLDVYIKHQKEVLTKRSEFLLNKAADRLHILEGFNIALQNIDKVINLIRNTNTSDIAVLKLIEEYKLTDIQAKSILEMRLQRLTGLERKNLLEELAKLKSEMTDLKEIINSKDRQKAELIKMFELIKTQYGDKRITQISLVDYSGITDEDLIPKEDILITLSNTGYIKRIPLAEYNVQNRGGTGSKGTVIKEGDFVSKIIVANTHTDLLFFTSFGKVYRLRGHDIPRFSKIAKGDPIINLLPNIDKNLEKVKDMLIINDYEKYNFLFFTKKGLIKKTKAIEFSKINRSGKKALKLNEDDELLGVTKIPKDKVVDVVLGNQGGKAVRFQSNQIREMGRATLGVRGIHHSGGFVKGFATSNRGNLVLAISEKGFAKLTNLDEYRSTNRGTKGVKTLDIQKAGRLVDIRAVNGNEDLMIIKENGVIIRTNVDQIPIIKRNTKGVKVVKLRDDENITGITIIDTGSKNIKLQEQELNG